MKLNSIQASAGSRKARQRLGCGIGTGQGKTGGRGHKGQKSRSGGSIRRGFEGGQMPLIRRLPKRGFTPMNKKVFQLVNVAQLSVFDVGTVIDSAVLFGAGLVRNAVDPVKLLATGEVASKLEVNVAAASASAIAKIEAVGGSVKLTEAK